MCGMSVCTTEEQNNRWTQTACKWQNKFNTHVACYVQKVYSFVSTTCIIDSRSRETEMPNNILTTKWRTKKHFSYWSVSHKTEMGSTTKRCLFLKSSGKVFCWNIKHQINTHVKFWHLQRSKLCSKKHFNPRQQWQNITELKKTN